MKELYCHTEAVGYCPDYNEHFTETLLVADEPLTDAELEEVVDFVFDFLYPEDERVFLGEVMITREEYLHMVKASPLAEEGYYELAYNRFAETR